MKKVLLFVLLFVALIMTGCGNNGPKLVCAQKSSSEGVSGEIIAQFNNSDELVSLGFGVKYDVSKYTDNQIEIIKKQNFCEAIKSTNMAGFSDAIDNCKQDYEDKNIVVYADFDIDRIKNGISRKTTLKEAATQLEKAGFDCVADK